VLKYLNKIIRKMTTLEIIGIFLGVLALLLILSWIFNWGLWAFMVDIFDEIADFISDVDFDDD